VYAIAGQIDLGVAPGAETYVACKATTTEALGQAADLLVQMLGGRGYIESNGAPQILRDARVLRILEGPTETLYAHLGASLAKPDCATRSFLSGVLDRPALAAELDAAVNRVAALADGAERLFGSRTAMRQWIDYRLGELAAGACLLGAAEHAQQTGNRDALASSNAVVWARRRFNSQLQSLLAELAAQRPYSGPADLLNLIAGYAQAIGDVDQRLPGEAHGADALLRRTYTGPSGVPRSVPPQAAAPVSQPVQQAAGGSDATRAAVHDCILRWLRAESRREVDSIGFDIPFATLGMDSLATASIAVDLEQRLGMPIAPEVLFDYQSINELAVFLDRQRGQATRTGKGQP
jgi:acyl carrier protein